MVGRKQKPENLKILQGTFRQDRVNKDAPEVLPDLPHAPEFLSTRARKIFSGLVVKLDSMGYASDSHTEMLMMAAIRLEEVELYSETIKDGATYETTTQNGDKLIKARPEVGLRSEAMRHAQSILAEFGLSPASMGKVSVPKAEKKGTKWAELGGERSAV